MRKKQPEGISTFDIHRRILAARVSDALLSAISVRMRDNLGKYSIIPYGDLAELSGIDSSRIVAIISKFATDVTLDEISDIMLAMGMELHFSISPMPEFRPKSERETH